MAEQDQLQLQISEEIALGNYANLSIVSFTENEFVLDFAFVQPSQPTATVRNRVVINPKQAKRLALIVSNAIVQYESKLGTIEFGSPSQNTEI